MNDDSCGFINLINCPIDSIGHVTEFFAIGGYVNVDYPPQLIVINLGWRLYLF